VEALFSVAGLPRDPIDRRGHELGGSPLLVTRLGEEQTEPLELRDRFDLSLDPVAERQLFDRVNDERTQRGVTALPWDERLVAVSRALSERMFKLKYVSHDSPVAGSPFDSGKRLA